MVRALRPTKVFLLRQKETLLRNARNSKTVCNMDTIKVTTSTEGCVSRSISRSMSFSPRSPCLACLLAPARNDTVAKLPRLPRETRILVGGRVDGVGDAARRDAADSQVFKFIAESRQDCSIDVLSCHLCGNDSSGGRVDGVAGDHATLKFIFKPSLFLIVYRRRRNTSD